MLTPSSWLPSPTFSHMTPFLCHTGPLFCQSVCSAASAWHCAPGKQQGPTMRSLDIWGQFPFSPANISVQMGSSGNGRVSLGCLHAKGCPREGVLPAAHFSPCKTHLPFLGVQLPSPRTELRTACASEQLPKMRLRELSLIIPWHASSLRHSALSAVSLNALYKPEKREAGSILLWSYWI